MSKRKKQALTISEEIDSEEQNKKLQKACLSLAKRLAKHSDLVENDLIAKLVRRGHNKLGQDNLTTCRKAYAWMLNNGYEDDSAWEYSGMDTEVGHSHPKEA